MNLHTRTNVVKQGWGTLLLWVLTAVAAHAQEKDIIRQYIIQYESLAIAEMKRTGVPAAIKLAQGIHETQAGTSTLVQRSNNHFGIKCKTGWSGPSVRHDDDARAECFRKYDTPEASYIDHSNFLKSNPRYFSLFDLSPTDYQGWAWGLKKAGYATNPKYSEALIRLIEEYDLNRYSLLALGQPLPKSVPASDPVSTLAVNSTHKKAESTPAKTSERPNPQSGQLPLPQERSYPAGVFEKDGCRAVWVKAGTSFLAIAEQYGIRLSKLFAYNGMEPLLAAQQDQVILLERNATTPLRLRNKRSR
ncbi:MAG: glycoside hydrolase family 73 protein [Sphingomonadales bacterium]